jgi:hypothetical protein
MKLQKLTTAGLVAGALAIVPVVSVIAASDQQSDGPGAAIVAPIHKTFSSGSDGGTKIDISTGGNVISFASPNGYEHLNAGSLSEGYVLCYTTAAGVNVNAFDVGSGFSGFAAPVLVSATEIQRDTTDGQLRLSQKFAFNAAGKTLTITMKLINITNLTAAPDGNVTNIVLRRQADMDTDTAGVSGWAGFANRWIADTRDGVTAANDRVDAPAGKEAHALTLRQSKQTGFVGRTAKVTANILDTSCNPAHLNTAAGGYARTDVGGTLQYDGGPALQPGKNFQAVVMYTRH